MLDTDAISIAGYAIGARAVGRTLLADLIIDERPC
jgi:hypothetical protein